MELFETAISHRSWCNGRSDTASNERLEFLGDAVLSLVVADYMYRRWPDLQEGSLAKMRSDVVSEPPLAQIALDIGLDSVVRLGKGEIASGGRTKPSILSDTLEALIGAIYLDCEPRGPADRASEVTVPQSSHYGVGGVVRGQEPQFAGPLGSLDTVYDIIMKWLEERLETASEVPGMLDYKGRLQEHVQKQTGVLPEYAVEGEGPEHARHFQARVYVNGKLKGSGEGRSKKDAEQMAAKMALQDW
ncbi:MAG: ribonuclease III family protein [Acidimicrobiales bacterium]